MRFGIPFTRPFTSPFGAPFPGSRRQTPTDYVAKYSAFNPNDFSLVTGNSVNIWDDRSAQTFGSELVTNGGFDTDSDWNTGTGWTISGGVADYDGTSGTSFLQQTVTWNNGVTYQIIINVDYNEGTGINTVFFGDGNAVSSVHLGIGENIITGVKAGSTNVLTITGRSGENLRINSISLKEVLTGANNLTQGTSENQPSLIQNTNPALNKVEFDANDFLPGLPLQAGDFTYVFKGLNYDNTGVTRFFTESNSLAEGFYFQQNSGGQWVCKDDAGSYHVLTTSILKYSQLVLKKEGAVLSLHGDGALVGNFSGDVTGDTFSMLRLGNSTASINGSLQGLEVFDRALSDQEIKSYGGA
jgi:hypothetical protein